MISELTAAGYIDDSRFAENYIRYRRNRGVGPLRIQQELRAKGIDNEVIAQRLSIADNAWFDEAQKVWMKHFKGKLPSDFKDKTKQMRFLQYRGFTTEHIEHLFAKCRRD